jgi:antitoxin PrlF
MALAQSKVTSQGQISVPAEVRKKLGVGPGSILQWDEEEGKVVIRRVGRFTSEEVHAALFPAPPKARSIDALKASLGRHLKAKHARR